MKSVWGCYHTGNTSSSSSVYHTLATDLSWRWLRYIKYLEVIL
jgi:hypothetical protein